MAKLLDGATSYARLYSREKTAASKYSLEKMHVLMSSYCNSNSEVFTDDFGEIHVF